MTEWKVKDPGSPSWIPDSPFGYKEWMTSDFDNYYYTSDGVFRYFFRSEVTTGWSVEPLSPHWYVPKSGVTTEWTVKAPPQTSWTKQ